jgi:ribosomal protein L40E
MRCHGCTAENPEHAKFCLECGAQLGNRCVACGAELPARAKFCLECGKPVAAASKPGPALPDPRSYTPKHLAEKILTSRSALEGERKQVTVLFADVKGSMDLAEQVDPEEWHKIMDRSREQFFVRGLVERAANRRIGLDFSRAPPKTLVAIKEGRPRWERFDASSPATRPMEDRSSQAIGG